MAFLEKVASVRTTLRGLGLGKPPGSSSHKTSSGNSIARALNKEEIQALKASASDPSWSNVRVVGSDSKLVSSSIRNCTFDGDVFLGDFSKRVNVFVDDKIALPCGLYNSYIKDSVILDHARVSGCELIDSTFIESRAAVVGCGIITCSGNTTFGNGLQVPIVVEVGGREIELFADLNFEEASKVIAYRSNEYLQQAHRDKVKCFAESCKSHFNIICSNAKISSVSYMSDTFIGEFATIRASQVMRSTIMSSQRQQSVVLGGSDVRDAILQKGCSVDSTSIVEHSLMCTHSHVEKHGKLLRSILGPLSSVAEGEVSSSFLGPLVGFHHQAGLIACYWPSGKGNVGFGANVGSNHTGKAPDQELWSGEGVFFGLGCCIKYPCDLTHSPYSIVASGVITLPQRVEFPFSLINGPQQVHESIGPAINCISPGWVLSHSLFTVYRNEYKFRARAEKFSEGNIEYRVLRPSIIVLMQTAKTRLEKASTEMVDSSGKPFYTEKHVSGLGKNFLTEAARVSAINIYSFFIKFYALQGLWTKIEALSTPDIMHLVSSIRDSSHSVETKLDGDYDYSFTGISQEECSGEGDMIQWEHQKVILADMIAKKKNNDDNLLLVESLIQELHESAEKITTMVETCKNRDDIRGRKIIHGYDDAHESAAQVSVTLRVSQEMSTLCYNITSFLNNLRV